MRRYSRPRSSRKAARPPPAPAAAPAPAPTRTKGSKKQDPGVEKVLTLADVITPSQEKLNWAMAKLQRHLRKMIEDWRNRAVRRAVASTYIVLNKGGLEA